MVRTTRRLVRRRVGTIATVSAAEAAVRLAYLEFVAVDDPAAAWLAAGTADARFVVDERRDGAIVRGADDLVEMHDAIDDVFGTGLIVRGTGTVDARSAMIRVDRPAAVMPLLDALRPSLDRRGPAFWTWKTAREAVALRVHQLGGLTVQAARS